MNNIQQSILHRRFVDLDNFLQQHYELWKQRPFYQLPLDWEEKYPEISSFLRNLPEQQVEHYLHTSWQIPGLPDHMKKLWETSQQLCEIPYFQSNYIDFSDSDFHKIRYRKQQQIQKFASTVLPLLPKNLQGIVDWCSGKGHLGRILGRYANRHVTCIEYNQYLCQAGSELATKNSVEMDFVHADVLSQDIFLQPQQAIVALHACGDLNYRLLQKSAQIGARAIAVSPCCYNKIASEYYFPLSSVGKQSPLRFYQSHLRLATAQEVCASANSKRQRRRESAWRMGFDLLTRETTKRTQYKSLPSFPKSFLKLSFREFCQALSQKHQVALPVDWCSEEIENRGWQQVNLINALGLILMIFQHPIELWLFLDRALFLEEHGFSVQIGRFCEPQITPRNLLIFASKN